MVAQQLAVMTPEKATLEWLIQIFAWVEFLQNAGKDKKQFVIKIEHALAVLERGHAVFYSVINEIQSYLRGEKIGLLVLPQVFAVDAMKGSINSLGMSLLRWASLLYECLKSDIESEDQWKQNVLEAIDKFTTFEQSFVQNFGTGQAPVFRDATLFRDNVNGLIDDSSSMIVQDGELAISLNELRAKMNASSVFQRCLKAERMALEERKFLLEKGKFENPQSLVDDRYDLLESLCSKLPPSSEIDGILQTYDETSLFVGEPSARDKSRFALEKSLLTGMETMGMDPKETDAQDFCSILAWELEDAVYDKYHKAETFVSLSNEYRDKIRSLRFNLQDPKNPMLCARVLARDLTIKDLISASTEELASDQLKLRRRQVEEEAIKNVVLPGEPPQPGITSEKAAKIQIDSTPVKRPGPEATSKSEEDVKSSATSILKQSPPSLSSPALSSPTMQSAKKEPNQLLASLPPPPMRRGKNEPVVALRDPDEDFPSPTGSPLLSPEESQAAIKHHSHHHISSQSGTDLFHITISKLKLSFTTKIAVDESCKFEVNGLLPSIMTERGRVTIDDCNKFIQDKARSGRWTTIYLKLSSITGDSNMSSYKRFYKEYESLGRIVMIQVSDSTKMFLVTPKFLRVCKLDTRVENISRSSTYAVVLTKDQLAQRHN
jgi:hypothetical protein